MKYKGLLMMAVLTATLLTACQKDELKEATPETPVAISIGTNVDMDVTAYTRAVATSDNKQLQNDQFLPASGANADAYLTGNAIAVYVEDRGTGGNTTTYADAMRYTTHGDGTTTPATVQYYPSNNGNVNIYAYYPAQSPEIVPATPRVRSVGNISFTVQDDQQALANYALSDLMYARSENVARRSSAVPLTFKHLLTKLTLTIKTDGNFKAGHLQDAVVTVEGTNSVANFNFNTGALVETASGSNNYTSGSTTSAVTVMTINTAIEASTVASQAGSAIVVPQIVAAGTEFIKVTLSNGGTYVYKAPAGGITLQKERQYNYTITLTNTGIQVFTAITPWGEEVTGSGSATQPDA